MSRRLKGEGSIYWNSARDRWEGQATVGIHPRTGNRRRVKVTGAPGESKASVGARLRERIEREAESAPSSPETVGDLVAVWRARSAPKRKSESTLAMTDSLIRNHIEPALGQIPVADLTAVQVEAFLDARVDTLSRSTLNKLRTVLAQAYDFGIRRRHAPNWNPARVAELPPEADATREGRALTASEARTLLNVASEHRLGAWVTR